jgi:hypothetical protein
MGGIIRSARQHARQYSGRRLTLTRIDRRTFIVAELTAAHALHPFATAVAQTNSLQDVGGLAASTPTATIFTAREIITLDPARTKADAIAVSPGKRANLTILKSNTLSVDLSEIRNIGAWGTVVEGRKLPAGKAEKRASIEIPNGEEARNAFTHAALDHALKVIHAHY